MNALVNDTLVSMARAGELPKTFWTDGPIADKIGYHVANPKTYMRLGRVRNWLLSNGHPIENEQDLKALLIWHQLKTLPCKTPVLGFKYLLLKEEERGGGEWNVEADETAERLARGIVRRHKKE